LLKFHVEQINSDGIRKRLAVFVNFVVTQWTRMKISITGTSLV